MKKRQPTPPLSFSEYERLYNVIQSLSDNWGNQAGRSCVFFSITGAVLMQKHYQLDAKVVCGNGAVMLDAATETVLHWFGKDSDGTLTTAPEALHAWIECDGWLIDLMAPNYKEALASATRTTPIDQKGIPHWKVPRKMLQKPISETQGSLNDVIKTGDCIFVPNQELTNSVIDKAFEREQVTDILNIALDWHAPASKKIRGAISITDNFGEITEIRLNGRELTGKW